jgi:hypothetical protein
VNRRHSAQVPQQRLCVPVDASSTTAPDSSLSSGTATPVTFQIPVGHQGEFDITFAPSPQPDRPSTAIP